MLISKKTRQITCAGLVAVLCAGLSLGQGIAADAGARKSMEHRELNDLLEVRAELSFEHDGEETLYWKQENDHYRLQLRTADGKGLLQADAPAFFRPAESWSTDVTGDGIQDVILLWREEASGGAASYWVIKGGQAPQLLYQSEPYLQGKVDVSESGVAVQYSVYEADDANAFPSLRVTERWGGEPWRKLAQSSSNVKMLRAAQAGKESKNPPLHEIEAMLEEVAKEYRIPAVLLKAVAWQESTWRQFDQNGNPLISYDGGIGIMQLTNQSRFDQERLKKDIRYNMEAGAQVLLEKRAYTRTGLLPSIGKMDNDEMESWYFTLWAYNGWSVYNNPHNIPNKYRKTAAYQDSVLKIARDTFGQPITRIPKEWISSQGVPSGSGKVDTPLPVHQAGEDVERRHFDVGDEVEVAKFTATLNARQSPGLSAKVIDVLQARERAEVVKEPTEKDGVLWYQVKSKDGKGWVSGFYLNAVRDDRISLAEVLQDDLTLLANEQIKADGRNLYLQADDMNLSWSEVNDGALQQALAAYPWQSIWLEWTQKNRKEKAPKPSKDGFLQKVNPPWGERNVPLSRALTLQFHRDVDGKALSSQLLLKDSRGNTPTYTLLVDGRNSSELTLQPENGWKKAETYTLYYQYMPIARFSTGAKSADTLDGFRIYPQVDTNVTVNKTFEIGFTQKLDAKTVTKDNIWLEDESGQKVDARISLTGNGKIITIDPKESLRRDSSYICKITRGIRSAKGIPIAEDTAYLFRTKK